MLRGAVTKFLNDRVIKENVMRMLVATCTMAAVMVLPSLAAADDWLCDAVTKAKRFVVGSVAPLLAGGDLDDGARSTGQPASGICARPLDRFFRAGMHDERGAHRGG